MIYKKRLSDNAIFLSNKTDVSVLVLLLSLVIPSVVEAQEQPLIATSPLNEGVRIGPEQSGSIISEAGLVQMIYDDLQKVHECDRPSTRYFVFRHMYGETARNRLHSSRSKICFLAISKLANSLSWSPWALAIKGESEGVSIIRFDLRNFRWDAKTWDKILDEYPYGLKLDSPAAHSVYSVTRCKLPYVRADWFVFAASRPPLYYDILNLPTRQTALEAMLMIDVKDDIYRCLAWRSGFSKSGISKHNRLVEFHKTGYGSLWKTYDFSGSSDQRDLFSHPTGPAWEDDPRAFRHDGGEIIFNLPNGLQAYMLVDGSGNRLDKAPITIVADTNNSRDPVVVNAVSCMGCHDGGLKALPADEIRPHVEAAPKAYDSEEVRAVQLMHHQNPSTGDLIEGFSNPYASTLKLYIGTDPTLPEPVQKVSFLYESDLPLELAATEVGLSPEQFRTKLNTSSPTLKRALASVQDGDGSVQRQAYLSIFPLMAQEWELGEYLTPLSIAARPGALAQVPSLSGADYQPASVVPNAPSDKLNPYVVWLIALPITILLVSGLLWLVFNCWSRMDLRGRKQQSHAAK